MAANKLNSPQKAGFAVSGSPSGKAIVIFENRTLTISSGYFSDYLSAFGTQVYMIDLKSVKDITKPYPGNRLIDPGFENSISPGVPASCYARGGGDRGATYFTDTREHFEGIHSIRLVTPADDKSIRLRFFPVTVNKGRTYMISLRAKADPGNRFPQVFEVSFGEYRSTRFELTNEWQEFVINVTIPIYSEFTPRNNVILKLPSAGVAWFDLLQVFEAVDINRSINPEIIFPGGD